MIEDINYIGKYYWRGKIVATVHSLPEIIRKLIMLLFLLFGQCT